MFLHLTLADGSPIVVNSAQIVCMKQSSSRGTFIETTGIQSDGKPRTINVTETLSAVTLRLQGL